MRKLINKKKGFTLIELLVVVAILGILMLLAVPRFMDSTKGSKVRTFESNFRTLMSMANQYSANNAGVFTKISDAQSDVKKLAGQLKDKPDSATYEVSETNIVATLDLQKSNISDQAGSYVLTYTYADGEVKATGADKLPKNVKSAFVVSTSTP
ncbi:type II secretion system protein [Parvimonas micra]|uniref:type II secretion system protein n=1 Tax=Parvimonas micra TaxID=33033 RepID=UPI00241C3EA3|nr:type II secretion system protein [Parvimonas micra]